MLMQGAMAGVLMFGRILNGIRVAVEVLFARCSAFLHLAMPELQHLRRTLNVQGGSLCSSGSLFFLLGNCAASSGLFVIASPAWLLGDLLHADVTARPQQDFSEDCTS